MVFNRSLFTFLFSALLACTSATAQSVCPLGTISPKLICLIPEVFGANGVPLEPEGFIPPPAQGGITRQKSAAITQVPLQGEQGHFQESILTAPLNSAIGTESSHLSLASPSSGINFSWDPAAKVFAPSTDSFGPILGERANTIGKYRLFLGFSYQYFKFNSLDGLDLKSQPAVFTHADTVLPDGTICSVNSNNTGDCAFVRDVIKTDNRIDLKIHQFTTFVGFGLTNRIDISMAIPVENVRMGVFTAATIVHNDIPTHNGIPGRFAHVFAKPGCDQNGTNTPDPQCFSSSFSNVRSVSGIGDITLRVKGTAWKGERAGVALGVDVRVPSGDELNFLGAGAIGVKPFVIWSYRSRISPHVFVGYEANGSSILSGDLSTGSKQRLPGQLSYAAGADVGLTKRFSAAFDLVGQQVFEAPRVSATSFTELGACISDCVPPPPSSPPPPPFALPPNPPDRNVSLSTGTYNTTSAAVGFKVRPFSTLLIIGNISFKLNDGGLRSSAVPLIGVSYTF